MSKHDEYMHIMSQYDRPSKGFRALARLYRALGDNDMSESYDRQAEMEEEYESNYEWESDECHIA
jgi:hypothetical protein